MGYNPFDFLGTDKRKRISPKVMGLTHDVVTEHKLREMVRAELKNYQPLIYLLELFQD